MNTADYISILLSCQLLVTKTTALNCTNLLFYKNLKGMAILNDWKTDILPQ